MKKYVSLIFFGTAAILWLVSCKSLPHDNDIKVLTIEKVVDKTVPNHEMCESLGLTKKEVVTYFSIAKEVSGNEFHHEAIILPCKFKGSLRVREEHLQWEIFAGGAGYLYNKESIDKRFICKNECCKTLPNLC